MPAMNNILSKWVPVAERSRSLALVYSGMYLGSVTGLAFSPFLIHQFGWPSVFYSFGSLGTVWFSIWLNKVRFALVKLFLCIGSAFLILEILIDILSYEFFCYWVDSLLPYINYYIMCLSFFCSSGICCCRHTVRLLMILSCELKKRS